MKRSTDEMLALAKRCELFARALGVRRAARALGLDHGQVCRLRLRVNPLAPRARLPNPGNTGRGKLSLPVARAIRTKLARGEAMVDLAERYGVRPQTIGKIRAGKLYAELGE